MAQSQPDHCSPPIDDQRLSKPISITTPKPGPGICCRALALYKATSVIEARKEFAVRQATEQKKASEAADDNRLDFEGTVVDADLLAPRSPRSSKVHTNGCLLPLPDPMC